MNTLLKLFCIAVIGAGFAVAQSVDLYITRSYDGNNYYGTAVMQVNMSTAPVCQEPSNPCARAIHTYRQTVTITSPSGRKTSCSFGPTQYPALTPVNLQCEASLSVYTAQGTPDLGDWSIEDQPSANCSIAGYFISPGTVVWFLTRFRLTTTYYAGCTGSKLVCNCQALACQSGIPTCTGGLIPNLGSSCQWIMKATYLAFITDSGFALCPLGAGTNVPLRVTGGPCS